MGQPDRDASGSSALTEVRQSDRRRIPSKSACAAAYSSAVHFIPAKWFCPLFSVGDDDTRPSRLFEFDAVWRSRSVGQHLPAWPGSPSAALKQGSDPRRRVGLRPSCGAGPGDSGAYCFIQ